MATLFIDEKKKKGRIAPEIYGQFSEHLGRGIYQGIYVGEDSEIPNENGMRKDVVNALRELRVPVIRWPGGMFCRRVSLEGYPIGFVHKKVGNGKLEKRV